MEKKSKPSNPQVNPQVTEIKESSDYEFIKEQIKDRPINRRKLLRRLLITAGTAVLFSLIACILFFLLKPFIEDMLSPKEDMQLNLVTLQEAPEEALQPIKVDPIIGEQIIVETPIENISVTDEEVEGGNTQSAIPDGNISSNQIGDGNPVPGDLSEPEYEIELDDYQMLYRKMYALSVEFSKSMVVMTGIDARVDWMDEEYLKEHQTTGLILADNGYELLVLTHLNRLEDADSVQVTFVDNTTVEATLKCVDEYTGLAVYGIRLSTISIATKEIITTASFGNSTASSLLGNAVIAVGNPLGNGSSVCYGAITSMNQTVNLMDGNYQLLTTDIYGSKNADGFLINMRGQVIGFITQEYNSTDMQNLIYAYGISSIRPLIQNLSNDIRKVHLGLYLADVPEEAIRQGELPQGAYVTNVEMNSPAMNYGISKGDVITMIGDRSITSVSDYMQALSQIRPGETVRIMYSRWSGTEYRSVSVEIILEDGE